METREGFRYALSESCWHGETGSRLTTSSAFYIDCLGGYIWLSLIGSKLEAGSKIKVAENYSSSSGHFGPIVTGIVVWLPGLIAADSGLTS